MAASSASSCFPVAREQLAATKLQALFRGRRGRLLHVDRVRRGLPWSPFVPAKAEAVAAMLRLAQLQPGETLLDIGSGDGRVLLAALEAQPRLRAARGVEIDAALVAQSTRAAHARGLADRVRVAHADWLDVDMRDVDVVVLFFLPHADMAAQLARRLRPGTRVVTYVFEIAAWTPERVESTVPFMTHKGASPLFRYRVPEREEASVVDAPW